MPELPEVETVKKELLKKVNEVHKSHYEMLLEIIS